MNMTSHSSNCLRTQRRWGRKALAFAALLAGAGLTSFSHAQNVKVVKIEPSTIERYDRGDLEVWVKGHDLPFQVTHQTRFYEQGQPVTTDRLVPGAMIQGDAEQQPDQQLDLVRVLLQAPSSQVQKRTEPSLR